MELPPHTRRRAARENENVQKANYLRIRGEEDIEAIGDEVILELPPHTRRRAGGKSKSPTIWRNYLRIRGEELIAAVRFAGRGELPPHTRRRD